MTLKSSVAAALTSFKGWDDEDFAGIQRAAGAYELAVQEITDAATLDDPSWALLSEVGSVASAQLLESAMAAEEGGDLLRGERLSLEGARIARSLASLVRAGGAGKAVVR